MSLGEELLELTAENHQAQSDVKFAAAFGFESAGRTPAEIGVEYESVIRKLLRPAGFDA